MKARILFLLLAFGLLASRVFAAELLPPVVTANPANFAKAAEYNWKCDGISLLVMLDGQIVFESYPTNITPTSADTTWFIASGTKGFWGPVAAAMIADGMLTGYDELVSSTITEWQNAPGEPGKALITIRQLLSLTSGLDANYLGETPLPFSVAITAPLINAPGTVFDYGHVPFSVFGEVLRRKLAARGIGLPVPDPVEHYLKPRILDRIGSVPADWKRTTNGDPHMASGGRFNARNWVKFGELLRLGGTWTNGDVILPQATLDPCFVGTTARQGYGTSWWLEAGSANPVTGDTFSVLGAGGQNMYVSRSRGFVVVRQTTVTGGAGIDVQRGRQVKFKDKEFFSLLFLGVNATADSDGDLIPDTLDQFPTNPNGYVDTDLDGLDDTFELRIVNANPNDAITSIAQVLPQDDFDGDLLTNQQEFLAGSDPTVPNAAILVTPSALSVVEGATATATVRLNAAPLASATVNVARSSGDTGVSVSAGSSLTFTPGNWNLPQTVTFAGAEDADATNGTATISCTAAGWVSGTIVVTEIDNDVLTAIATASTSATFQGRSVQFNGSGIGGVPWQPDVVWFDDALPTGAVPAVSGGDAWNWIATNPAPKSGTLSHQSVLVAGDHRHWFDNATATMSVGSSGDLLVAWVYIDPANPPQEIMLRWNDGDWNQGAFWGADLINYGVTGTTSRRSMGPLPAAGQWVRLTVPASQVALAGKTVKGMGFMLYDGRAAFDTAGKGTSTNGTVGYTYLWDFGDGTTSTLANPAHTFAQPGTRTVRLTITDSTGATSVQTMSVTVRPVLTDLTPPWEDLRFTLDFLSGSSDVNGQFMGGTEIMALEAHNGMLFAATGLWNWDPSGLYNPGSQILVKKTASAPWQADATFPTNYGRMSCLHSVNFTTDLNGTPLATPVRILLGGVALSGAGGRAVVVARRELVSGGVSWTPMVISQDLALYTTAYGFSEVRHLMDHYDAVTGVHSVIAAVTGGAGNEGSYFVRGAYDPTAPGRIRWSATPDGTGPGGIGFALRALAGANANGSAYIGVNVSSAMPGKGGLFRRVDGAGTPSNQWQLVYEWPLPVGQETSTRSGMRGMLGIPNTSGVGEVLLGCREVPGVIDRIDPAAGHSVVTEFNIDTFLTAAWGSYNGTVINPDNNLIRVPHPDTGEPFVFATLGSLHPDRSATYQGPSTELGDSAWYVVRKNDASYRLGRIFDPAYPHPIPDWGLRTPRSMCASPFPEDAGRVIYAAGYEAGPDVLVRDTAWIYRGELPRPQKPLLDIARVQPNRYRLTFVGTEGAWYLLEHSTNLATWAPLENIFCDQPVQELDVDITPGDPRHFFRARFIQPPAP